MYKVKVYKGEYIERQKMANKDKCIAYVSPQEECEIRVMKDGEVIWTTSIDADDDVSWDQVRGVLRISQ